MRQHESVHAKLESKNLEVKNANLVGLPLRRVPTLSDSGIVISRLMHGNQPRVALPDTVLQMGDIMHAVGSHEQFEQLRLIVGDESAIDIKAVPSNIAARRLIVTQHAALGRSKAAASCRRSPTGQDCCGWCMAR